MGEYVNGASVDGGGSGTITTLSPLSGDGSSGTPATIANGAIADGKLATSYIKADGSRPLTAAWSTGAFDVTFGAKIIGGTIGPTSGQQHTLPAVTSDTVALIAASQTLTNKTLSGGTVSGSIAGTPTWTGAHTFSAAVTANAGVTSVVTDATTNDLTQVVEARHMTSGTAANNIASAFMMSTQDSGGSAQGAARISGIALNATTGAPFTGAMDFWTWTSSAWNRRMRLGADGGLLVGSTVALGAVGIGLPKDISIYGGNAAGNGYNFMLTMVSGTQVAVGSTSTTSEVRGSSVSLRSNASVTVFTAGHISSDLVLGTDTAQWGRNDASATPTNYLMKGADAAGTNIAGVVLTMRAPLGTGTGTAGILSIEGGQVGTTGTTQHATATLAQWTHSATNNDTFVTLGWRKSGANQNDRVTVGAADSGGTGFRVLVVPN